MNFQQAVNYVMQSKMAAFAFLPKKQEEIIKGCELFILTYCDMHEEEPDEYPEYNLQYLGGYYYDSSIEEGSYWPEEIPDEAKSLSYFKTFEKSIDPGNEIQITLKQLNGIPLEEARFDEDCEDCEKNILENGRLSLCEDCILKNN